MIYLVKKANARMELVRKVASFGASEDDLKNIYFLFVRSLLEQSATVWHSSLTQENCDDLERVQKSAVKIILGPKYDCYKKSLVKLDMESLQERREFLCLTFAQKCLKSPKPRKCSLKIRKNIKWKQETQRNTLYSMPVLKD